MKTYLEHILAYLKFEKNDAEFLLAAYDKIANDSESLAVWDTSVSLYESDYMCDKDALLLAADKVAEKLYLSEYTAELLMYLCLTRHAKTLYDRHGYSEEIYRNTMLDLKYKLEECKLVKGIVGIFVAKWFAGFFELTRFALGRLQFELMPLGRDYEKNGVRLTPESIVINVHIPRTGTPLSSDACENAFSQAREFFKETTGERPAYVCESWLLYPENADILPKHTNTYAFMNLFDIIESKTYRDNDDLWRLFDTDERNPERLPGDTSMRRAYISHLKKGGKTGEGFGIFIR